MLASRQMHGEETIASLAILYGANKKSADLRINVCQMQELVGEHCSQVRVCVSKLARDAGKARVGKVKLKDSMRRRGRMIEG